jgi:hypothetical protein
MNSNKWRQVQGAVAAGLLGLLGTPSALAQLTNSQGLLENRFIVNAGAFIVSTDVKARVDGTTTAGQDVDFDDRFGTASDETRGRLDALWRITPRHHLRFMYFDNRVTRNRVLDRDITWGDNTYHVGANVESQIKLSVYELAYEYAFLKQPTYEVSGTFGIHYSDLSLKLAGQATGPNGGASTFVSDTRSVPAPLPTIGIRAGWAFHPQIYGEVSGQALRLNIDGYKGHWYDARAGVTWMFMKIFGAGLAYNRWFTRVDVDRDNFNGFARFGYSGIQAFVTGTF